MERRSCTPHSLKGTGYPLIPILLLLLLALGTCSSLELLIPFQTLDGIRGQPLVLPVHYNVNTSSSGLQIIWLQRSGSQSKLLITSINQSVIPDFQYQDRFALRPPNASLLIHSLRLSDEGTYIVKVNIQGEPTVTATQEIYVSVHDPVSQPVVQSEPSYGAVEHIGNITFRCWVRKGTRVTYQWLRNGSPIQERPGYIISPNNNTFTIIGVTKNDIANYSCLAKNFVNEMESDVITPTIYYGPYGLRVISDKGFKVGEVFTIDIGESVRFDCSADSNPPNTCAWIQRSNNSTEIINYGPYFKFLSDNIRQKTVDYLCRAYNNITGRGEETQFTVIITPIDSEKLTQGLAFLSPLAAITGVSLFVILSLCLLFVWKKYHKAIHWKIQSRRPSTEYRRTPIFSGHEDAINDFGIYEFVAVPDSSIQRRVSGSASNTLHVQDINCTIYEVIQHVPEPAQNDPPSELNSKLQDTLEQIEEQLDVALSKICKNFDVVHYTKVQQAYRLLGKTQTAMDQLHMHFTQAIHNTVFQVVLGYVELCAGNTDTKFQKLPYKDLCMHITCDSYIPCLTDLCKALWEVMLSYYRTMQWHEKNDQEEPRAASDSVSGNEEDNFDRSYIKKKLEHGLTRIWQDVQLKVKTYLLGTDMSSFKYDDFIVVLDIVSRLMQVGEEFCGSKSEVLQESIRKQSVNYFKNYHRTRLEELRMFLENETWELCPVKSSFNILQLHEFKCLTQSRSPSMSPSKLASAADSVVMSLFEEYVSEGNPFEIQVSMKDDETEDVLASNGYESDELEKSAYQEYDSDSDVPEELKRDYVDEQTGDAPSKSVSKETLRSWKRSDYNLNKMNAPILTNTTLNVIRLVGKYLQMMTILKPIAFDVIHCMSQLFDYYLYAVYTFFGRNDTFESTGLGLSSSRLRTTLNRIQESLIDLEVSGENSGPLVPSEEKKEKIPSPRLSQLVVLTSSNTLYGLAQRVVATESLVFLAEQFEFLQTHLDSVMPAAKKPFLQQFYSQTVSTASELRKPIYWIVAAKAIDYEQLLLLMVNVKWDVKEIMSQHNVYVDALLKEFELFNKKLSELTKHVRIPLPVSNILWEHCIRLTNRTLVEGYANVKKCSNEGRALMQLDFQQFLMKLEKLTDIRPIPDKEYVETYIKAYYLTENDMERWIKEHREYSNKQLTNLVNVCLGSHINKKARQKLLAAIDDTDRPKR